MEKSYSTECREICLWQGPQVGGKKVLIIAGFHGDEVDGVKILRNFVNTPLAFAPKNNLFVISCFNPDGYIFGTRVNPNAVDLNRNFPTKNWESGENNEFYGGKEAGSEAETKFMLKILDEIKPDLILSIHAPFRVINYDGPASSLANEIAKIMNYPVQKDIGYPTPGSFGTYCGVERNIPTITLELGHDEDFKSIESRCLKVLEYLASY